MPKSRTIPTRPHAGADVVLTTPSGTRLAFPCARAMFDALPFLRYRHFLACDYDRPGFSAVDATGNPLDWGTLAQHLSRPPVPGTGVYRRDPVPSVFRRGCGSYWRHPRTQAERRAWFAALDEAAEAGVPVGTRARRSARLLPTMWDDQVRTQDRNWKRRRAHQWR